jgi:superkiller protein 3
MWLATAQSGGGGGDVPGAIGAYRRALALEPSGKGWTNLGVLIQKHLGRLEDKKGDALKAYKQAVKVDPDLAEGYYNLGSFYEKDRQHEAALRAYSWAVELDPEQGHYFTNLAGVHISLEQSDKAYQAYEKALEVNPKLPDAWVGLGNIEGSRGRLDLAVIRYKKALKVQPKHAKAKRRLKQAKADMSKEKEAMKANADKMQALEDTAEQCGNNVACMQARLVANGVGKRTHDGRVEL